ncbi:hypothetical protein ABOM_008737 [Aspergillus bombycis]|uniref:Ketosynthase family 3 (KS3) domain-containing protein n=1 Tax=Aspergillus bombycis TaxID=109264 RepID=A0A1F7ZV34_9EURO|nr:hypothetical protein ABOM_008737 [Aspergillus bombycis]OGM43333.1 hypothetical protein ABOM_008737 [Aspergillus bombycis]
MTTPFKLLIFGDQTYHVHPHLRELVQSNEPILVEFLDRTYAALRTELFRLPPELREALPRFTSITDLALWGEQSEGVHLVALDMAVTCLYHLAAFISRFSHSYPLPEECHILGLCTGTLAASAVSCCTNVLELVPIAIETVVVAFRTGLLVSDVGSRIEAHDNSEPWSLLVPSSDAAQAVQDFCQGSALPLTSQPYISAYSPSCVTVTGPPSILSQLKDTKLFQGLNIRSIPVYAPYHARHLFSPDDIEEILRPVPAAAGAPRLPVISSITGDYITAPDIKSLLKVSLEQILLDKIDWNQILEKFTGSLTNVTQSTFTVVPFGTLADQTIYSAARQESLKGMQLPHHVRQSSVLETVNSGRKSKIAIVGMSGRFPNARDREAFWDLLYEGLDVHKEVPPLHWDARTHVDVSGKLKNTSATPFGCWLDDPAAFDARFFNMSPREAPQVDPAQRIALMTAYEAIEQAGLVPDATPSTRRDRVGVFYGVTSNDWMETNSAQNIDTYFIPGGNRAFIPGRINYFFKFSGPSYAVDTACSSSLAAIHVACNSLWRGDIDTAIAGGTNILTNPDFTAGLDRGHFLSRTGNCKTFDDEADGYCRGEGVGTVILKRLEDALAENDPIQGVILGAYTNHSAEADSITRPHVGAQRAIFRKILNESGVDPYTVSYVECHGTGTQAGDATEIQSVLDTFAPSTYPGRGDNQPLYLGSAKANIGHGEAASGVSSLAKVLLMLEKGFIPPHCGIKTKINHKFPANLEQRNGLFE